VSNTPTVTTQLTQGGKPVSSITTGSSVTDNATLSGSTTGAGTSITINVYKGTTGSVCTSTNLVTSMGPIPVNGDNTYSATFSTLAAGDYEFQAVYVGDAHNQGTSSQCGTEPLTVTNPVVSQITPTQTTCSQFKSGTAPTLSTINYALKSGKINSVNPGVFFYWVKVSAPATYTITQAQSETSKPFLLGAGSNAYDSSCNTIGGTSIHQSSNGNITVTFSSNATGPFFIGLKFSTKNVVGEPAPSPNTTVTYTFSTSGVAGSTSKVQLVKQ
jgi:hypothetical protein